MRIILLHLPFGPVQWPSIGLSLLAASMQEIDVECEVRYFALDYAKKIGVPLYQKFAENEPCSQLLLGEWVFSGALHPTSSQQRKDFLSHAETLRESIGPQVTAWDEDLVATAAVLHDEADEFIESCFAQVNWADYDLVGFSSTFQQNLASLALAKRIKADHPDLQIAFGGSNWEGPMGVELLSKYEFVDWTISGEGDLSFPKVVSRIRDGERIDDVPGVYVREKGNVLPVLEASWSSPVRNMNALPQPDFSDYFEQVRQRDFSTAELNPTLLFETSRGCWWGQKHHCTFCGLNGESMFYRRKKPDVALDQLCELVETYNVKRIQTVDDIIDMSYFKTFLPELIKRDLGLDLFYETKANLTKAQVEILTQAGVSAFQPGIESLSDTTLRLMDKGVTGVQNIRLLKWSREFGIQPAWNILWGFDGEDLQHYEELPRIAACLSHLPPPVGVGSISIHRFSPLYEADSDDFEPVESYRHLYWNDVRSGLDLHKVAYLFKNRKQSVVNRSLQSKIVESVRQWNLHSDSSDLLLISNDSQAAIVDTRQIATVDRYELSPSEWAVLRCFDNGGTLASLKQCDQATELSSDQLVSALEQLQERGYVLKLGGKYISLPTPAVNIKPNAKRKLQRNSRRAQNVALKTS